MRIRWFVPLLLLPTPALAGSGSQDPQPQQGDQDLSNLSIEELSQIPVRSASKRDEPLNQVPTAAYVITGDDIVRSAATSLPEVLRQAPNLEVERLNATQYAISARGFQGYESANKLLVLMDGRSIYSTLHSGVFWDLHSPLLEDIAQIEVMSGPSGTLYGPNAVNGVISIRSRDAFAAQGLIARGTVGADDRTLGARYGFMLGDSTAVRVYGNWFDRADNAQGFGPAIDDSIRGWQAGFRADNQGGATHLTLQGDIFSSDRRIVAGEGDKGQNLLARWTRDLTPSSSIQLQAYYDYFERRELLTVDRLETFDAEAQYNLQSGAHTLVAGVGARSTRDRFVNNLNAFALDPQSERLWIGNGFVQDRIALSPRLALTAGVKLEASSYTGIQALPSLRLAFQPSDRALFWAAVSRAVRTPSRIDRDLSLPGFLARAPDFASEKLTAFEAGFRGRPGRSTTLSISTYFDLYADLRSARLIGNPFPGQLGNDIHGHVLGIEATITQQLMPWWRVTGGASWLHKDFAVRPGGVDLSGAAALGQDPDYQFSLRSQMNLPGGVTFDAGLRAIDGLDAPQLPGYAEADARLGVRMTDKTELFVAGENLLHDSHYESNDVQRAQRIGRSVWAGARLRF